MVPIFEGNMYWVYVIRNNQGTFYKGITNNLNRRISQHNNNQSRWTSKNGPWNLVYSEKYDDRVQAREREKYLKSGIGREYLRSVIQYYD